VNIAYGPFIARLDNRRLNAEIAGRLDCDEWFSLCTHTAILTDRDVHYFDIFSGTAWPEMNAHERSQLRVLMRKLCEIGIAARKAGGGIVDPDAPTMYI
jgi:hypothetical protein